MTAGLVIQVLVTGLAAGAVYGLVAMGFSLVYRLTSVLQLAHGDVVGLAIFTGLLASGGVDGSADVGVVRYATSAVAAIAVAAAVSAGIYLLVVRRFFRRGSSIGWIGGTVGVAFAIEGMLAALFPREGYLSRDALPFSRWNPIALPNGAHLPWRTLWVLALGIAVAGVAHHVLTRTRFGLATSAIASEPLGAQIVGLPVERLITLAFALAGALAGVAGLAIASAGAAVTTQTGLGLGLKGIAAALLARFASPMRVFGASLALGVGEAVVTNLHVPGVPRLALGPAWHDVAPIVGVIVVLAFSRRRDVIEIVE